jgi:copper chaperone CopZ
MPKTSEAWPIFEDDPFVGFEQLDVTTLGRFKNILKKGGPMQDSTPADDAGPRFLQLDINGMHCMNCVVAVERSLKDAPGVQSVRASYPPGRAVISYREEMNLQGVYNALEAQGYNVKAVNFVDDPTPPEGDHNHLGIAAAFLILIGVAFALQHFQVLPRSFSVSDQLSYGLAFLIGLVASVLSCLAVTGSLLVALAAKYNEANPYLTDQ